MSSGSNVCEKREEERERFSKPLAALGIALSFILLLVALFPEKKIIRSIDQASDLSPVVLDYLESMLRRRPDDPALRLRLAEALAKAGEYRRALKTLNGFVGATKRNNRIRYLQDRCLVLNGILASMRAGGVEEKQLRDDFFRTARELAEKGASPEQLMRLAGEAAKFGDGECALYLLRKYVVATADAEGLAALSNVASVPRGAERYRYIADLYFSAMAEARSLDVRRALFMKGVRVLQAGGLPLEALEEGEKHLGVLESDHRTLLFMTDIALAADRPRIAQHYVKKALGMEAGTGPAEGKPCELS